MVFKKIPTVSMIGILLNLLLIGCAQIREPTITELEYTPVPLVHLSEHTRAYLAMPNEGHDNYHVYPNSQIRLQKKLAQLLSPHFKKLKVQKYWESAQETYQKASDQGYDFLILPRIEKWTESVTLFTGVSNQAEIQIQIYDLKQHQLIDTLHLGVESGKLVLKTPPDTIVEGPLRDLIEKLFTQPKTVQQ